jgi:glucose/arabinose dehydrogenase
VGARWRAGRRRPAYVLQMPDGALLVSDEQNGAIYRVSYRK